MGPEVFPDLALHFVSLDRCSASLKRNAEPKVPQVIGDPKDRALGKAKYLASIKEAPVLPRVVEPSSGIKSLWARTAGGRNELLTGDLDSEALTAFGAAAL